MCGDTITQSHTELRVTAKSQKLLSHPELRADGGLASGRAHLQRLVSVSAADALEEVVDEVEPADTRCGMGDCKNLHIN